MKRHGDETIVGNKTKFRYTPERPLPQPSPQQQQPSTSHQSYGSYSYQSQMWVDPRTDPKNHANMNMFQPQNMMMPWSNTGNPPLYNPMQPPPPLPSERPPLDAPPPPPPMHRRNMLNNNMNRRPMNNPFRPDRQGYMNLGPYKKNMNHQNHQNHQNHGMNQKNGPPPHPGQHSHLHPHQHNSSMSGSLMSKSKPGEKPDDNDKPKPALKVNKKARRKPMSERYTCKKEWNKDDAIKALTLENAYNHLIKKVPMLILRFPDPELNKALIHSYSPAIETVHFQQPSRARYCFVQLKPDADIEQVKKDISQIEFGTGKISVENKITRHEVSEVTPEQLDPYTLYVGNLPTKLNVTIFKEKFPTAKRIDIGYAQRTKFTRYAFLHYDTVEDSMEAFKSTYNLTIDARSLVVRFRRNKGSVGLSEKGKKAKKDEGAEGADGDKKETKKTPSGAPLFDDEMIDSKAHVKDKAEELLKQGFGLTSTSSEDNLMGTNVKQEPLSDDECNSEDGYGEYSYNENFDEEDYLHSDYEGSDNEYDNNENCEFGLRHWERGDQPIISFVKKEKPDDYNEAQRTGEIGSNQDADSNVGAESNQGADSNGDKDKDDLDELFSELNPDDGLEF